MNSLLTKNITCILLFFLSLNVLSQTKKTTEEYLNINDSLYSIAISSNSDSLLNKTTGRYVQLYYRQNNWKLFNQYRKLHIPLTYKLNDTLGRARTFKYMAVYFSLQNKTDSTYYYSQKSFEEYNSIHDSLQAGYALVNLAVYRKNVRDYTGSKYMCHLAINYLKDKADARDLSSIYNTLATNYSELNEYDNSLEYHYKGLALRKQILKDTTLIVKSLSSIGDVHITHKKYSKAIEVFNMAKPFKNHLRKIPKTEAILLDNLTYARFKNGEIENIEKSFYQAIELGKKANYIKVQINALIHLAEYYKQNNDVDRAISKATEAERLSREHKDFNAYLRASKLLSILLTGKASERIIETREAIRDSLEIADKRSRDAYNAIELEVEKKESLIKKNNEKIKTQLNVISILMIVFGISVIVFVLFLLIKRRQKKLLSHKLKLREQKLLEKEIKEQELRSRYIQTKSELEKKVKEETRTQKLLTSSKDFEDYLVKKYDLSERGLKLLKLIFEGKTQMEQAVELNIPESTLKTFKRTKFYPKLNLGWDIVSKQRATAELYQDELEKFNSLKNKQVTNR
ncbi:tetratricopeptide repeat protein [Pontimicrobium sp. MEBiC06410]